MTAFIIDDSTLNETMFDRVSAETRSVLTPEQRAARWQSFADLAAQHEPALEAVALSLFAGDAQRVARLFGQVRAAPEPPWTPEELAWLEAQIERIFAPNGPSQTAWTSELQAPVSGAVRAGATATGFTIPMPPGTRVSDIVKARTARLAGFVGPTTARQIEAVLVTAEEQGWSTKKTADMINETVFGGLAKARAAMIARTESCGAVNTGAYTAAIESGAVTMAEWLTQQDDRVRPVGRYVPPGQGNHRAIDGQRVPLGVTFDNGCLYPGDPDGAPEEIINCRCAVLFS